MAASLDTKFQKYSNETMNISTGEVAGLRDEVFDFSSI